MKIRLLLRCKAYRIRLTLQKTDLLTLVVTLLNLKHDRVKTVRVKSYSARPASQSVSCCAQLTGVHGIGIAKALLIVFLPERADTS
jgi:hypothetical protein